jgi:hypothetical protein
MTKDHMSAIYERLRFLLGEQNLSEPPMDGAFSMRPAYAAKPPRKKHAPRWRAAKALPAGNPWTWHRGNAE